MKNITFRFVPILMLALMTLAGCVKTGGNSSSSGALVHGMNEGSASEVATTGRAAQVISATPGVISIAHGKVEKISKGMNVPLDAILRSDAKGKAKLSLPGGATVNVSPNSEVALADFADTPEEASSSGSLSESLSSIFSGKNAKKNQLASSRNDPQATIGVRGLQESN